MTSASTLFSISCLYWQQRERNSSTLLNLCEENPPVTGGLPSHKACIAEINPCHHPLLTQHALSPVSTQHSLEPSLVVTLQLVPSQEWHVTTKVCNLQFYYAFCCFQGTRNPGPCYKIKTHVKTHVGKQGFSNMASDWMPVHMEHHTLQYYLMFSLSSSVAPFINIYYV